MIYYSSFKTAGYKIKNFFKKMSYYGGFKTATISFNIAHN